MTSERVYFYDKTLGRMEELAYAVCASACGGEPGF